MINPLLFQPVSFGISFLSQSSTPFSELASPSLDTAGRPTVCSPPCLVFLGAAHAMAPPCIRTKMHEMAFVHISVHINSVYLFGARYNCAAILPYAWQLVLCIMHVI